MGKRKRMRAMRALVHLRSRTLRERNPAAGSPYRGGAVTVGVS
jgi:hypothetical protein